MNSRMRLGPLMIILTIITITITMLAMLTLSTANADVTMAQRFADTTKTRYALESEGEYFLSLASDPARSRDELAGIDGVSIKKDTILFEKELDGYKLELEISTPDHSGRFMVNSYQITRLWKPDDPMSDIWKGN